MNNSSPARELFSKVEKNRLFRPNLGKCDKKMILIGQDWSTSAVLDNGVLKYDINVTRHLLQACLDML
ncbi:hypothetical protein GGR93_002135 [Sulfitobacter noctilucicola]|uniref:Uncharacterized protein n=1 Tax=Sulfitobacter noctilucicola TaxID=1342301 RepID=A0A7W6M9W9_9RHOB|nr:hypothetical protein [Sulfitobacter noctilucicola]